MIWVREECSGWIFKVFRYYVVGIEYILLLLFIGVCFFFYDVRKGGIDRINNLFKVIDLELERWGVYWGSGYDR